MAQQLALIFAVLRVEPLWSFFFSKAITFDSAANDAPETGLLVSCLGVSGAALQIALA